MSGLVQLLGEKVMTNAGEVSTMEALQSKKAVALYFSAHWCPPCKGFTPKLAEWYTKSLKSKGLEIVFVSSDKDEAAFTEYFGEMPWIALPYSDRDRKEALSKKYKVQGIPTVVILDGEGNVITKDGRAAISNDPEGEEFPWKPKSLKEILAGATLIGKDEHPVDASSLDGKVFGLYFSAHWCPPCRGFTPQLAEWYKTSLKDKGMEIVFVSSDRDEKSFQDYFAEQPWLALSYSCRKEKEQLSNLFGVSGIPSFVIIDKDGSVITKDGRAAVSSDPTGAEFPWYPKPVSNLSGGPGPLNDAAVVVALCEAASADAQKAAEEAMTPFAKKYIEEAKAKGEEEPEIAFMIATSSGGIGDRLRQMTGLPTEIPAEAPPRLILMNIPDDGAYFTGPEGAITKEIVETFVADFSAGKLERQQLKG
jgi:nucleoredoxin